MLKANRFRSSSGALGVSPTKTPPLQTHKDIHVLPFVLEELLLLAGVVQMELKRLDSTPESLLHLGYWIIYNPVVDLILNESEGLVVRPWPDLYAKRGVELEIRFDRVADKAPDIFQIRKPSRHILTQ
ncbi:hypothetical protein VTO42DRAFT_779 [Malbranchea cinnamomea]